MAGGKGRSDKKKSGHGTENCAGKQTTPALYSTVQYLQLTRAKKSRGKNTYTTSRFGGDFCYPERKELADCATAKDLLPVQQYHHVVVRIFHGITATRL